MLCSCHDAPAPSGLSLSYLYCFCYTSDCTVHCFKASCPSQRVCWGQTRGMIHSRSVVPTLSLTLAAAVPMDGREHRPGQQGQRTGVCLLSLVRIITLKPYRRAYLQILCDYPTITVEIFKIWVKGTLACILESPSADGFGPPGKERSQGRPSSGKALLAPNMSCFLI